MTIDPSMDVRLARRAFARPNAAGWTGLQATDTEWAAIERLRRDFPDTLARIAQEAA